MKIVRTITFCLLFAELGSCKKKQDPTPVLSPQQLLIGTWRSKKVVRVSISDKNVVVSQDSLDLTSSDPNSSITYQGDGTLLYGKATGGTYVFNPPKIDYYDYTGPYINSATLVRVTSNTLILLYQTPFQGGYSNKNTYTFTR